MQIIIPTFGGCRETCCEITNINSNNLLKTRNYPNCVRHRFEECWKGQFFITLDEEGPDEMKNLRREYTLLRNEKKASRVRGWVPGNTKIGPVLVWRSKTLRYRNRDRILASRQNSFLGSNCEWNRQIRNRNGKNHFSWKRWAQSYSEICCDSKATTYAYFDTVSHFYSWIDSNPERFRQDLFHSVKGHDQITATWSINSSRRWWSSTNWRYYGKKQGKVRWYFAMANYRFHFNAGSSGTRRGTRSFSRRTRRTLFSNPTSRWLKPGMMMRKLRMISGLLRGIS